MVARWTPGFNARTAEWYEVGDLHRQVDPLPSDAKGGIGQSLGMALVRVWNSAEADALTSDGGLCRRDSRGLLTPAPTILTGVRLIGKESRRLGLGRGVLSNVLCRVRR
jgi:hypothetical protein